jgi:fatty acid desaturase
MTSEQPAGGGSLLGPLLVFVTVGGLFILLTFLTSGFVAWILVLLAGFTLFGLLHYLLWGAAFLREVAQERASALREQADFEQRQAPPGERRF